MTIISGRPARRFVAALCALALLAPAASVHAQALTQAPSAALASEAYSLDPSRHQPGLERGLTILGDDFLYVFTAPLRPTVEGLLVTGGIVAGVALVSLADREVRDAAGSHRSGRGHDVIDGVSQLGNAPVLLGINLVGVAVGEGVRQFTGDRTHLDNMLVATEAQILTLVMSEGLAYATARSTPRESSDPFTFKWGRSSFPSSHTSQAFAAATVLADRYGLGVGAVAYTAAAAVGAARILQERHWASDVAAGAALGWAIGYTLSRRRSQHPPVLDFFPFADPGTRTYGFLVSSEF
jgi:membrane-associated phospholipid phosphatase